MIARGILTQRWQRLSKQQQLAVAAGMGALGLWVVYAATLRPLQGWLRRLHHEVREAERQLTEAVVASRQAEAVNEAFAAYAPYVKPAEPPEAELAGFLGEVEAALRQSGVTVLSLKPVAQQPGETDRLGVAVEGESDPAQLIQFLDTIHRSTRLLKVTELAVRTSESKTLRSSLVITKLILPGTS